MSATDSLPCTMLEFVASAVTAAIVCGEIDYRRDRAARLARTAR